MEKSSHEKLEIMLKNCKRRYDGGAEVAIIALLEEQIAHKKQLQKQKAHYDQQKAVQRSDANVYVSQKAFQPTVEAKKAAEPSYMSKRMSILVKGPLQICVGFVGILTSGIALVVFHRMQQPQLIEQSRQVFNECTKSILKGIIDTACSPVNLVKASIG